MSILVILVTAHRGQSGQGEIVNEGNTTMKNALILIAFALAIIAGSAAEAVETHRAVLYATTNH